MFSTISTLAMLILSVFVFYYSQISYFQGIAAIAALYIFVFVINKWLIQANFLLTITSFVLVLLTWSHLFYDLSKQFTQNSPIEVQAKIKLFTPITTYEFQKSSNAKIRYQIGAKSYVRNVKISMPLDLDVHEFCEFEATLILKRLRSSNNRFIYDGYKWMFINKIHARSKVVQAISTCNTQKRLPSIREQIRLKIINMDRLTQQSKGLLLGVLFGDQSFLQAQTKSLFINTQTIHLMVVSGLHIGVCAWLAWLIGALIYKIIPTKFFSFHSKNLNVVMTKRHIQILLSFCLVIFYGYLAQFNPPAVRAIFMILIPLGLWLFNKKMRIGLIWGTSLIALVVLMPAQVLSLGFWLSITCVTALVGFFSIRHLKRDSKPSSEFATIENVENVEKIKSIESLGNKKTTLINKSFKFIWQLMKTQWVILLVMTPLIMFMGAGSHGFSFVINLILVPIVTLMLVPLGLILIVFDWPVLQWVVNNLCSFIIWFLSYFENIKPINISINLTGLILLEISAFIWIFAFPYRYFFNLILIMITFLYSFNPIKTGEFYANILDVGQGQSVVIQTKTSQWVVDVGPGINDQINNAKRVVAPYLKLNHSNNRVLALSHDDNDHAFGYKYLLDTFNFELFFAGQPRRVPKHERQAQDCRESKTIIIDNVQFNWMDLSQFTALEDNDYSCVLLVSSEFGSIIITGDLSKQGEYYLSQVLSPMNIDVLVIGHHGSNSSTSQKWLNHTNTKYAIVSRGLDNQFSHPHIDVLNRLEINEIPLLDTATLGQIQLMFVTDKIKIKFDQNRLSPKH